MYTEAHSQDRGQGRSMVVSRYGIVAAESPVAAQAGVRMLEQGGTAVDAAVAANAMMGVVAPKANGSGGALFAIVYDAETAKFYGLNASGVSPAALTHSISEGQRRLRDMPERGIDSVTVPGAVDGWQNLLDRFGNKKLADVLAPAIRAADEGVPITEWVAAAWAAGAAELRENAAAAQTFLVSDRAPAVGQIFRDPDLGRSLRLIAQGKGATPITRANSRAVLSRPPAITEARSPKRISPTFRANGSTRSRPPTAAGPSMSCRPTARALPRSKCSTSWRSSRWARAG